MTSILGNLVQDARYAIRGLLRTPGFTLVVVLTLAIATGTNTAIFSVVDQLLLRPLPYPDGDRVVLIYDYSTLRGTRSDSNPGNWLDWQRQSQTLESIAAWDTGSVTLSGIGDAERLELLRVSSEFFPLLGVQPLLGRVVSEEDDRPNAPAVAVLSYAFWQRRFGGDRAVIGRIIQLNEAPTEVIGVMPPGFRFIPKDTDFWTAFQLDRNRDWRATAGRFMSVVARIRPTATLEQAQSEMQTIARGLESKLRNEGITAQVVPLRGEIVGDLQAPILMVYGAVLMLLAIGCLNIASLLLARAMSRTREIAVRASIGAGRWSIVRPFLVESLVLAAVGGALGVLVARWSLDALIGLVPSDVLPINELRLDSRLLGYALGISLVMGTLIGLIPALAITRRSLATIIRSHGNRIAQTSRLRHVLVIGQVAMTVVLLCGAGLLVRTVAALNNISPGFTRQGLLTMEVQLPPARYNEQRVLEFFNQVRQRLAEIPGVESTSAGQRLPVMDAATGSTSFSIAGDPPRSGNDGPTASIRIVAPGYFKTLGTPIVRGREFTDADQAPDAPLVFVVNQAFVTSYLSGKDPFATAISVGFQVENPYARIVGVVGDVPEGSLSNDSKPTVFYNHKQIPSRAMVIFTRGAISTGLARAAVDAVKAIDPNIAVANVRTIDGALGESIARERLVALVSGTFAVAGLLLAALGLYGLLTFVVSEQTREIGIRMALGARVGTLLRGVLTRGLLMVGVGVAIGIVGAVALARSITSLFFGVSPYDPLTYGTVLVLIGSVAAAATLLPAVRASRVDPVVALRGD